MSNTHMKTVFSDVLEANELRSFRYKLSNTNYQLKGLLHSNSTELSISFQNQTELEIESLDTMLMDALELPPIKRIVSWEQDLRNCAYITGTIRNLSQTKNIVNLYLILAT